MKEDYLFRKAGQVSKDTEGNLRQKRFHYFLKFKKRREGDDEKENETIVCSKC